MQLVFLVIHPDKTSPFYSYKMLHPAFSSHLIFFPKWDYFCIYLSKYPSFMLKISHLDCNLKSNEYLSRLFGIGYIEK